MQQLFFQQIFLYFFSPIKFAKSLQASLSFKTTLFLTIIKILSDIVIEIHRIQSIVMFPHFLIG